MSRILLAEDEAALLEVFAEVLEDLGHEVVSAHDGEEALRLARLEPPDLVVSDHMMPRRTGVDLLRALRAEPAPLGRVPFILTSAATPRGLDEADLFLAKPLDLGALEGAVRQLLPAEPPAVPASAGGGRARSAGPGPLREEMLNWVAHELKTPLSAARLKAQLLVRRLAEGHARPEVEGAHAQAIVAQLDRMAGLVSSILDAARLAEGRVSLAPRPQDLVQLLHTLVAEWRALAPRVQFVLQVPEAPVHLPLDAECVRQVLGNVASNAVKYGGETGRVDVRLTVGGALARVDVVDQGPGIPAAQLPHVFDRFHRLEQGRGEGHGLGLYIASQLARLHGGSLGVVSQLGEGATFSLRLPLARGA